MASVLVRLGDTSFLTVTRMVAKVVGRRTLMKRAAEWRRAGDRIVWTNGCFDLLHVGHVHSLYAARRLGDRLVVGVNGDESVSGMKGPHRPIYPLRDRLAMVAALECVDCVVAFDDPNATSIVTALRPEVLCKGSEYRGRPDRHPEAIAVKRYGGRVVYLAMTAGRSTTATVERAAKAHLAQVRDSVR